MTMFLLCVVLPQMMIKILAMMMMMMVWPALVVRSVSADKLFFERQQGKYFTFGEDRPRNGRGRGVGAYSSSSFACRTDIQIQIHLPIRIARQAREYFCLSGPCLFVACLLAMFGPAFS